MSAEIINLNKVRKAKARAEREKRAAENRAAFGRSKASRDATQREGEIARARLDGARRADPGDDGRDPGNVS